MEQLSKTLQYKDINAQQSFSAVNAAKRFLERQRDTSAFGTFYASVVHEAQDLTEEPKLCRQSLKLWLDIRHFLTIFSKCPTNYHFVQT